MHKAASAGVATPPAAKFTTWAGDRSKHTSYRLVTVQRGVCWQLSCLLDLQERQRRVFLRRRDAGETMTMTWPAARGRWERQSPASQRTDGCNLVHVEGYDHEPEGLPHISYLKCVQSLNKTTISANLCQQNFGRCGKAGCCLSRPSRRQKECDFTVSPTRVLQPVSQERLVFDLVSVPNPTLAIAERKP